jgi:hypothetical protein
MTDAQGRLVEELREVYRDAGVKPPGGRELHELSDKEVVDLARNIINAAGAFGKVLGTKLGGTGAVLSGIARVFDAQAPAVTSHAVEQVVDDGSSEPPLQPQVAASSNADPLENLRRAAERARTREGGR